MKKLINLLLLLTITSGFAQDFKFGEVSKAELQETSNTTDPEAHATILYVNEKVFFEYDQNQGFVVVTEVQKRIKIYDKEGADWATESVAFYDTDHSEGEDVSNLKGYTYRLVNGKIEKDKLDKGSVFKERTNKYYKKVKFTMPNITDGCVVEFQYRKQSPFIAIDDLVLQYDIPVKKLEFRVSIPEYFYFNKYVNLKSKYVPKIQQSKKNRRVTINSKERNYNYKTTFSSDSWDFVETVYEASLDNIPALKEEPFVESMDMYRCVVNWEYAMYKGPDMKIKSYSTDWESVTKTIYDHEDFGGQISKTGYFEEDIDALVKGESHLEKRIPLIYNFVKSKVAWNDYYGYYTDKGVRKAFKEGAGNVAEINLMLTAMLRYAGLNANPVLVSTKSNGTPLFPTRNGFNYVIAAVETAQGIITLDASHKFALPNVLPSRAVNWQGRIIRKDGTSGWINVMSQLQAKESYMMEINLKSDLTCEGKVRASLTNASAMKFRGKYNNMGEEERLLSFEKNKGEIEISNLEFTDNTDIAKNSLKYTYDYNLNSAAEQIGNKIYVTPKLFLATSENAFKEETRMYPIDFTYPVAFSFNIMFILPEGYKIESLPESSKVNFNGTESEFSYVLHNDGSRVLIKSNFNINRSLIIAEDYSQFKSFYGMMVDKETEKIVLVKDGPKGTE